MLCGLHHKKLLVCKDIWCYMSSRKSLFSPSSHDGKMAAAQELSIRLQKCWGLDITWSNIPGNLREVSTLNIAEITKLVL